MRLDQAARLQRLSGALRAQAAFERRLEGSLNPLQRMLSHATASVPGYGGAIGDTNGLGRLQTIARGTITEAPDEFLSDRFPRSALSSMTTSGTSGVPLTVWRDPASAFTLLHDTYRIVFERIPELGAPKAAETAVAIINDNPDRAECVSSSPALEFALVHRVVLNRGGSHDRVAPEVVRDASPQLLYGRPRSLLRLAELSERHGSTARPKAILCSGDNLYPDHRRCIEDAFAAPVYNAYGSQECGFVALECSRHQGLHVLPERAVVEVLPAGDRAPASEGTGELVVSNLENFAMPILRYRTGDHATIRSTPCACGHRGASIVAIDGRDSPYFATDAGVVNPSVLNPAFEALPIRQFQIVQHADRSFTVNWVPAEQAGPLAGVPVAIEAALRAIGADSIGVEQVARIGAPDAKVQRYVRETA